MTWRAWFVAVCLVCTSVFADETLRVQVADPFLELHTGPGRGYPLFHVAERGEWVEILKRRTDWFKIRTADGKEGWVPHAQLVRTMTEAGAPPPIRDPTDEDYRARRWEFGFSLGDIEGDRLTLVRGGYRLTENVTAELSYGEISGDFASGKGYYASIRIEPFHDWRLSPFFVLGAGRFESSPRATLVNRVRTEADLANAGVGVNYYLTHRFMLRADYKAHAIFVDANRIEEFKEASLGVAFFF